MKTSLKAGCAQIFSCCPKNLSCPKFGGAAAPLAPPARTPMWTGPKVFCKYRLAQWKSAYVSTEAVGIIWHSGKREDTCNGRCCNLTINEWGWVYYEELWRSRRVLSVEAVFVFALGYPNVTWGFLHEISPMQKWRSGRMFRLNVRSCL